MFEEILKKPGFHPPLEFRVPHKDRSWRYLKHVVNNLLDDPSMRGVVVTSRDVTERVRAEEELRQAEERYRMLVEHRDVLTRDGQHVCDDSIMYGKQTAF